MSSAPRRTLPERPDLEQQRKLAKDLLRAFNAGDPGAISRIRVVLPDKQRIALADAQFTLAREYGFPDWTALTGHIASLSPDDSADVEARLRAAFHDCDVDELRRLFGRHPEFRHRIDEPVFSFNSPAIVAFASNPSMVELLLELGADPNKKSEWWAGGFHALYSATPQTAERLIAAGSVPDACAAAHLDRPELLAKMIAEAPQRVHERGGDGQTPLHFAQSREVIDLLLDAGADMDARDVDHRSSPAEWMLDRQRGAGRYDLAAYLVVRGARADIFMCAALGLTNRAEEMIAANPSLLDLRTGQGDYGEKPPSSYHIYFWTIGAGRSPLEVAHQFDQVETLEALLSHASPAQHLLMAASRGDSVRAHAITRQHPDLVASLPLQAHSTLATAAWNGNASAVQLMIELGFDPRATGDDAGTALHLAAWQGSRDAVEAILTHPAAAEMLAWKDAVHGGLPLGWCCHGSLHGPRGRDHAGVARLLVLAGGELSEREAEASQAVKEAIARARAERRDRP